jgi:folate-binding protein YgfZ
MAWDDPALAEQYELATTHAAVFAMRDWTTLRISGADRASFLHNMCTNDIRGLPVGGQCEAFVTDVKGKIVGHVFVMAEPEQLLLLTVPGQAERLISHLERYIIREDVQLTDETAAYNWGLEVGPVIARRLGEYPPVGRDKKFNVLVASCDQIWPRGRWWGSERFQGDPFAFTKLADEQVWHALRIESGWPLFGVDFDGTNLPQEVGRDAQAISFRKGCYLGQETIARLDALGHVNKQITTVRLSDRAEPGDELTAEGESVGRLTSVAYSPKLQAWLALALVRRGHNAAGSQLICAELDAVVVPTPAVTAY